MSKNFWSDPLIGKESVEKCHITFGSYVTVEMKGQVHCIVGYRISHSVLCWMQLHILANVALQVSQILNAYSAQSTYRRNSMGSLIVSFETSTASHFIWENQEIISLQVIVQIFYHHCACILQIAIKGLKCSQNNKLTGKGK